MSATTIIITDDRIITTASDVCAEAFMAAHAEGGAERSTATAWALCASGARLLLGAIGPSDAADKLRALADEIEGERRDG